MSRHCRHASTVPHRHRRLAASTSSTPSAARIAIAIRSRGLAIAHRHVMSLSPLPAMSRIGTGVGRINIFVAARLAYHRRHSRLGFALTRPQHHRQQDRCRCRNIRSLRHSGSVTAREHPPTSITHPHCAKGGRCRLRRQCGQSLWRSASSRAVDSVAHMPLRRAGMSHTRPPLPKTRHQCQHRLQRQRQRRRTDTPCHMQRRLSFAAVRTAMHSNRATRIGAQ